MIGLPEGEEWSEEKLAKIKEHAKKLADSRTPEQVLRNEELSKKYSMQELFVPYQESIELKELGFDEPCFGFYTEEYKHLIKTYCRYPINLPTRPFLAPTFSQAFKWFREKHNLNVFIQNGTSSWMAFIGNTPNYIPFIDEVKGNNKFKGHDTYEEAELECLRKLIQIVKVKS